jgi:hypothetical protein
MGLISTIGIFLRKFWFTIFFVIVLLIYFFSDKIVAIVLVIIMTIILGIQIAYEYLQHQSFESFLKRHLRIDDLSVAKKRKIQYTDVKNLMSEMMNKKGNSSYLIVMIKTNYIYYNQRMVSVLKKVLIDSETEPSEIIRILSKYGITTRIELQSIKEALIRKLDK